MDSLNTRNKIRAFTSDIAKKDGRVGASMFRTILSNQVVNQGLRILPTVKMYHVHQRQQQVGSHPSVVFQTRNYIYKAQGFETIVCPLEN